MQKFQPVCPEAKLLLIFFLSFAIVKIPNLIYKMFFSTVSHFPDVKDGRIDILPFLEASKGIVRFVGKFKFSLNAFIGLFSPIPRFYMS